MRSTKLRKININRQLNLSQQIQNDQEQEQEQEARQDPAASNSMQRYIRSSLPNSIGHYSLSIRKNISEPNSDIYFNPHKKAKFMKDIVDNYFEDTLQKIYGSERETEGRELQTLARNAKNIAKRNKAMFSSIAGSQPPSKEKNVKLKKIDDDKEREKIFSKPKSKELQKDKEKDKGKDQEKKGKDQENGEFQTINSNSNASSFLPPIYESHQDFEQFGNLFPESSQTPCQSQEQNIQRIILYQNQAYLIYVVSNNGHPKYRVKQFKQSGIELFKREQRALKYGIQGIWKQSKINANSLTSDLIHPLKNLICKLVPNLQGHIKYKVRSSAYRKYLLANDCLELRQIIRQICAILKKVQGRVLNNKINPANIFILKGNQVCVGEWGHSSFREEYSIQHNMFQSRVHPILKSSKQWLASPQYMSPELIQAIMAQSQQQQPDIWQHKSSSDIWSLGISLFQVITMIPIWINEVCSYKLKSKKCITRCGLLATDDRKPHKIGDKQKKIQKYLASSLEHEVEQGFPKDILELVSKMLAYEPAERISLDQIVSMLK